MEKNAVIYQLGGYQTTRRSLLQVKDSSFPDTLRTSLIFEKICSCRHVALICYPAAKENDDLLKWFFTWHNIQSSGKAFWIQILNKCNLYSIMGQVKRNRKSALPQFCFIFMKCVLMTALKWCNSSFNLLLVTIYNFKNEVLFESCH